MERLVNVAIEALKPHAYLRPGAYVCGLVAGTEHAGDIERTADEDLSSKIDSKAEEIVADYPVLAPVVDRLRRGGDDEATKLEILGLLEFLVVTGSLWEQDD